MAANNIHSDKLDVDILIRLTRIDRRIETGEYDKSNLRSEAAKLLGVNFAKKKWLDEVQSSKHKEYITPPRRWRGFIINEHVEPDFCDTSSESGLSQLTGGISSNRTIKIPSVEESHSENNSFITNDKSEDFSRKSIRYAGIHGQGIRTSKHESWCIREKNKDSNWDYYRATFKENKDFPHIKVNVKTKAKKVIFRIKDGENMAWEKTNEKLVSESVNCNETRVSPSKCKASVPKKTVPEVSEMLKRNARRRRHIMAQMRRNTVFGTLRGRVDQQKWIAWISHMQNRMNDNLFSQNQDEADVSVNTEKPIDLWRRKANIVRRLCGVCLTLRKYAVDAGLINNFVVSVSSRRLCVSGEDGESTEELEWDLEHYRANREIRVPRATVEMLEKPPILRTSHDIQVIASLMRSLPSFRKYTNEMQLMMCRIVRYMKCTSRRVVLRKGHLGFSVYFIVTGSVSVVMDRDDQSVFVKPEVVILRKGACFGEIALLQNTRRNATIVCADDCEFLVIDKEDFIQNGLNERLDEEFSFRYNFYRNWPALESWSDDNVKTLAYCSRTEDYNYNKVIVSGHVKNEFLWFVVKGSCDLLKLVDLRHTAEYNTLQTLPSGIGRYLTSPINCKTDHKKTKKRAQSAPLKSRNNNGRRIKSAHMSSEDRKLKAAKTGDMSSQSSISTCVSSQSRDLSKIDSIETINSSLKIQLDNPKEKSKCEPFNGHGDNSAASIYVQIDQLRDGQCFGLDLLDSDAMDHKYSLVSKGCVIIHVPRRKFQELADNTSLLKIKETVKHYPEDHELTESFFEKKIWDNYKQNLVEEVIIDKMSIDCKGTGLRNDKVEDYMKSKEGTGLYGTMLKQDETNKTRQKLRNAIESHTGRSTNSSNNCHNRPSLSAIERLCQPHFSPRLLTRSSLAVTPKAREKTYTSLSPLNLFTGSPKSKDGNHLKSKSSVITGRCEGSLVKLDAKIRHLKSQSTILSSSHGPDLYIDREKRVGLRSHQNLTTNSFLKSRSSVMSSN